MKVIYKIWESILECSVVNHIRNEIYKRIKIDIELEVNREIRMKLKEIFENMGISSEQINRMLFMRKERLNYR